MTTRLGDGTGLHPSLVGSPLTLDFAALWGHARLVGWSHGSVLVRVLALGRNEWVPARLLTLDHVMGGCACPCPKCQAGPFHCNGDLCRAKLLEPKGTV